MKRSIFTRLAAASALALTALGGCAAPFKANVARFQQLPPAQGQSFTIVAENPRNAGGLEFAHYADLVAGHLTRHGYVRAADPGSARLLVRLDYHVDQGHERVESTGFSHFPYWHRPWGWHGWRGRYIHGFYDPFLFDSGYDIRSYTVYNSMLKLRIDRAGEGRALFEGTARAQSLSNKLTYLVPNLIDAMFTNFPGNSGEEIKVTVAPEPKK
ncbi:MAG TPA: DUF4136 domain-containing protein [Sphingobium sp.]|nr:DUF4136 domain-containing protein [Sphingobium sp.]